MRDEHSCWPPHIKKGGEIGNGFTSVTYWCPSEEMEDFTRALWGVLLFLLGGSVEMHLTDAMKGHSESGLVFKSLLLFDSQLFSGLFIASEKRSYCSEKKCTPDSDSL